MCSDELMLLTYTRLDEQFATLLLGALQERRRRVSSFLGKLQEDIQLQAEIKLNI